MTLVTRITKKLQKKSKARPKSLVLYIPAEVRDVMNWEDQSKVTIDVISEDDEKYVKIRTVE